jgi:hypothetical protein
LTTYSPCTTPGTVAGATVVVVVGATVVVVGATVVVAVGVDNKYLMITMPEPPRDTHPDPPLPIFAGAFVPPAWSTPPPP